MVRAPYDDIADWYEDEFLRYQRRGSEDREFADSIGIDEAIASLLGPGRGVCLEVGCGTGVYADRLRSLGRAPIGIDISAGMLGHAKARLPIAQANGVHLPFATASVDAALGVMIHSDMPDFPAVLGEVHRVLKPGATFLHVGVHPCFIGDFADRTDNEAIVVRPGYLEKGWTPAIAPTAGEVGKSGQVRDKVGAAHYPMTTLLNAVIDSGFRIARTDEGFAPTPITFSLLAVKAGSH